MNRTVGVASLQSVQAGGGKLQRREHGIERGEQPTADQRQRTVESVRGPLQQLDERCVRHGIDRISLELNQRSVNVEEQAAARENLRGFGAKPIQNLIRAAGPTLWRQYHGSDCDCRSSSRSLLAGTRYRGRPVLS